MSELWAKTVKLLGTVLTIEGATTIEGDLIVGASKATFNAATGNSAVGTLTATGLVTAAEGVLLAATADSGVTILLQDAAGKALLATGTAVPADTGAIYAKGCLFIDTDVATGTTGLYCNKGTAASCVFTAVTQA
jgi:hypothetical protein